MRLTLKLFDGGRGCAKCPLAHVCYNQMDVFADMACFAPAAAGAPADAAAAAAAARAAEIQRLVRLLWKSIEFSSNEFSIG